MRQKAHRHARAPKRFQFTEPQWKRICDSIKHKIVDPRIRSDLEFIAEHFRTRLVDHRAKTKRESDDMLALSKQAKLLLPIFERLSSTTSLYLLFAAGGDDRVASDASPNVPSHLLAQREIDERRRLQFRSELENIIAFSEIFGAPSRRIPPNLDLDRNQSWEAVLLVYEGMSGERAGTSVPSNLGTGHSAAGGPFIRFIQAFTAAVPGEKEPTGDQVRSWLRSFRKKYPRR